jgi:hypothetical protein
MFLDQMHDGFHDVLLHFVPDLFAANNAHSDKSAGD